MLVLLRDRQPGDDGADKVGHKDMLAERRVAVNQGCLRPKLVHLHLSRWISGMSRRQHQLRQQQKKLPNRESAAA
jgi:hypothetical protein